MSHRIMKEKKTRKLTKTANGKNIIITDRRLLTIRLVLIIRTCYRMGQSQCVTFSIRHKEVYNILHNKVRL